MRALVFLFLTMCLTARAADGPVTTLAKSNMVTSVNTAVIPVTNIDVTVVWQMMSNYFVAGTNITLSITPTNLTISGSNNPLSSEEIVVTTNSSYQVTNATVVILNTSPGALVLPATTPGRRVRFIFQQDSGDVTLNTQPIGSGAPFEFSVSPSSGAGGSDPAYIDVGTDGTNWYSLGSKYVTDL